MTTITQALVKRFYFEHFRKGFPKIEQSLIARFVLDPAMSKNAQLQAYLNFTSFGTNDGRKVIGFADAARTYYGREFARLSDHEFISLVAMLMAPNALEPARHKAANDDRVRRIEAMLAGKCEPTGLRDVTYVNCAAPNRSPS
jgi:membrane peptidoglycan carboxypeptidase